MIYSNLYNSPMGPIVMKANDDFLVAIDLQPDPCNDNFHCNPIIEETRQQLEEYFLGERREFTIPLEVHGTSFQKKVFEAMRAIGYGEVLSYSELALSIGHPGAFRAVGSACGLNRLPILIPCHRVISANGLGGFSTGISQKIFLLNLEGYLKSRDLK